MRASIGVGERSPPWRAANRRVAKVSSCGALPMEPTRKVSSSAGLGGAVGAERVHAPRTARWRAPSPSARSRPRRIRASTRHGVARIGRAASARTPWRRTCRIGPASDTSASSTCRPQPVMPNPGDSRGSSRQPPPATRVEYSLEKCPSMWRMSPSVPLVDHAPHRAHRGEAAPVVAAGERHAGAAAGLHGARRLGAGERERLFAPHRLAGLRRTATTSSTCWEWGVARNTAPILGIGQHLGEVAR